MALPSSESAVNITRSEGDVVEVVAVVAVVDADGDDDSSSNCDTATLGKLQG